MTKIAIAGAAGRMGQALIEAMSRNEELVLAGATERAGSTSLGKTIRGVTITDDPAKAATDAQVWIDFTSSDAVCAALPAAAKAGVKAAIVGATGLEAQAEAAIEAAARSMAVVRSGNFSVGVNLLLGLVRQAAARLGPEWDIEVTEAHHRRKVDAPSGTALMLAEAAAAGRGKPLHDLRLEPREGITGSRPEGGIGFAVLRAGGIVGRHEVLFASEQESVALRHEAQDRTIFADGALRAALWAERQKPGLYTMLDVLGL
jgi:4-hydroxy-tetrahydrodipicolinate reductase